MDDYRAYICIQYPGKDRIPGDREDEEVIRINREPEQDFNCHSCSFSTKRLEVMILHTKSHIQGVYLTSSRKNKHTVRRRKEKSKKARGSDVVDSDTSSSDSEPVRQKKRKPKTQVAKKAKIKKTEEEPPKKDIRSELLEAWEDSEDEELDFSLDKTNESASAAHNTGGALDDLSSEAVLDVTVDDSVIKKSDVNDTVNETDVPDQSDSTQTETADEASNRPKHADDAESPSQTIEEALNDVSGELDVPSAQDEPEKPLEEQLSTEKLLSTLEDDSMDIEDKGDKPADKKQTDEDAQEDAASDKKDEDISLEEVAAQKSDTDEDISNQKMDKDMHEAIKSCFDFDEDDEEDSTIVSKASSGRKIPRVIPKVARKKSSEKADADKSQPIKESQASKDKEDEAFQDKEDQEDMSAAFKELMEITAVPDLPDVQNTLKCEQNFHNIKTIKFPDKPEQVGSPPKLERKDSTEVATKLTNPKKRFVKSFEDFELMQNEIRRREEEQLETSKNEKFESSDLEENKTEVSGSTSRYDYLDNSEDQDSRDSSIQLSKLKSKIMSKIIEEAKINAESKHKIMSKMQEPKPVESESKVTTNSPEKTQTERGSSSHRSPRSKILESYRKDESKHKVEENVEVSQPEVPKNVGSSTSTEETVQDRLRDSQSDKDIVPPKKNKWSRRGSHPKKDKNLIMLQEAGPEIPAGVETEKETIEETTKSENQTFVELESIETAIKTNDIVLDEPIPTPADDVVSPNEVLEEEVVETVKEPEATEPQLTELLPLQIEENDSDPNKEETIEESSMSTNDESKVDENLSSTDTDFTETKESSEPFTETDAVDIFPQRESTEILEEASLGLTGEVPQEILSTTGKEEEEEKTTSTKEKETEGAQITDSPSTEECSLQDIPLANEEDTSIVPSNEKETVDSIKSDSEVLSLAEEHTVEDPLVLPEITEANASLPTDAIITPPKKSMKRKMSDVDVTLSPAKSSSKAESQSEDFAPLEKRIKDGQDVGEEIKVTSPLLESFQKELVQGDTETTEQNQSMDTLESKEHGDKENMETEPIVEIKETEKGNEECTSESKVECEEMQLDTPVANDVVKEEVIGKESEEKVEGELKSMASETAQEKPKEIVCNKELDPAENEHNNEVEIHCASSSVDSFKFSIQTNLSILSSKKEMSALALAALSEIKADLESNDEVISKETETKPDRTVVPPALSESEMVPIEGNLTVVSEKDLGDGQVEITSDQVISPKRPVTLSNFSMDFSDSLSDSNSNSTTDTSSDLGKNEFNSKGTEFTAKALTKQMKKLDQKKESTYGRLELINILEGNSDTEKKTKEYKHPPKKISVVDDICDFEEHIPSQIVCAKSLKKDVASDIEQEYKEFKEKEKTSKTSVKSTTSKLLERLTTESKAKASAAKTVVMSEASVSEGTSNLALKAQTIPSPALKSTKFITKSKLGVGTSKPIILSEQIVKPATEPSKLKPRKMEDIEDVEAFVIHKDPNKITFEENETVKSKIATTKTAGKAKILQQTIITPAGEIIQPTVSEAQTDDNIFDINSMPIVLSDEILTPESIEKMPIVIGSDTKVTVAEKVVKRPVPGRLITTVTASQATPTKTVTITKHKQPRILQTFSNKVKNSPLLPNTAKPGKYIIVPQSSIPPTKYLAKKPTIVKKTAVPSGVVQKVPNIAPEPSGNKIMIVTNQQGQQQRLLLTPAQQKMLGYQSPKVTKTIVKGNVIQKSVLAAKGTPIVEAGTSGVVSKTPTIISQKVVVGTNAPQGLITTTSHQVIGVQGRTTKTVTKRSPAAIQKLATTTSKPQKTILIKNQHGQTMRKIQGTDDELLDKQVAEQLKAIKASSGMKFSSQQKTLEPEKVTPKTPVRRSYSKRVEVKSRGPPPLSGLHQSPKQETIVSMPTTPVAKKADSVEAKASSGLLTEETKAHQSERPLNQLVIQDAVGNQTTITEGQILALPSETVDGQPQSYMLVTLDESGNLTPLNSEALMSLDPNLGLGGDLSNMVLQFDQSALTDQPQTAVIKPPEVVKPPKAVEVEPTPPPPAPVPEPTVTTEISETIAEQKVVPATDIIQPATPSSNGDPGQQLIVTGDPIATQKFLESLTEGTTDLANILANAEGNSILIQADGQQILINTNTDNQMLLSMNNDNVNVTENTEGGGNPIFATQPSKNQDILAAALADTDVFQQEHPSSTQGKISSQLSPNNTLYPMNVGNVLETSLTLSSPIMTPLEVPSTNNKKIPDDEADILTQVPKNVDLPITITDPNISQTVANQQVSQMICNDLQTNLELALPISETTISAVSTEMNSPSYVYSLPTLDDSVEMTQKPFNGSMPLLNEDVEETMNKTKVEEHKASNESPEKEKNKVDMSSEGFLAEEEGRFTLGGEMCSSLSEPPPEMFDLPEVNQSFAEKSGTNIPSLQSTPDVSDNASKDEDTTDLSQADTSSEGSCEIPLQPQIVTKSLDLSRNLDSLKRSLSEAEEENKKCKFD